MWRKPETSHEVVTYHKVTLKRSTDGATAKEPVVKERISGGTTAKEPVVRIRDRRQRASGEKNEVKQHGYEDSEKTSKIWSNDEKNREEQSQQQAKQTQGLGPRQGEVRGET